MKYWVDVQQGIVLFHGVKEPLEANLKKVFVSYSPGGSNKIIVTSSQRVKTFFFAISLSKKIHDKTI